MLAVNKSSYNQPSIHFARKDQEVVVILVGAHGTKWDGLRSLLMWAWILRKFKVFVLICGIIRLGLQSRCMRKVHGTKVLLFKRFNVRHWARGTRLKLTQRWWRSFNFIEMRDRFRWNERGYELHFLEQNVVNTKPDMDRNFTSSSRTWSTQSPAIGVSKQGIGVAKVLSLNSSLRLLCEDFWRNVGNSKVSS